MLNAVFSILNLVTIIYETGYLNPYTYQGQYQKYFISTGDFIKGLTFDTSTTNAVLNAFGVIYFLTKRNTAMLFVCMGVMLLTGSNFTNMFLLGILLILFIFKTTRDQKSLVLVCLMFLVVFMVKVSPQNNGYVHETFKRTFHIGENSETPKPSFTLPITLMPDSLLSPEQIKQKIAHRYIDSMYVLTHPKIPEPVNITTPNKNAVPVQSTPVASAKSLKAIIANESGRVIVPVPNIHTKPYQHVRDTTSYQWRLLSFIGSHKAELPISAKNIKWYPINGKVLGFIQTTNFLHQHPDKILTGAGTGNFSSKLAFRTSGLGFAGGYPQKLIYLSPDFLKNHLDVYLNFFSKQSEFHTLSNNPGSVYDQLLAEYGLLGLAAFVICYLGFFLRHYKKLSYGLPILMVVLAVFLIDYWFEQLSILLFFELLLLLNIKESSTSKVLSHAS